VQRLALSHLRCEDWAEGIQAWKPATPLRALATSASQVPRISHHTILVAKAHAPAFCSPKSTLKITCAGCI
jgi:hypothetical protein